MDKTINITQVNNTENIASVRQHLSTPSQWKEDDTYVDALGNILSIDDLLGCTIQLGLFTYHLTKDKFEEVNFEN